MDKKYWTSPAGAEAFGLTSIICWKHHRLSNFVFKRNGGHAMNPRYAHITILRFLLIAIAMVVR